MNFQQIRIIQETVRQNFNLTEVAHALATSQSGVSKHIRDLENELGVELFMRRGKRLLGLTEPGRAIIGSAERIMIEAGNIRRVADRLNSTQQGKLTIATTHSQARYLLPDAITQFREAFPGVQLVLTQTNPADVARMLIEERADIGIATEAIAERPDLQAITYRSWRHVIVAPRGHALDDGQLLVLDRLAQYPLITYHRGFTGRRVIDRAFLEAGVSPDIVMEAIDADVIKTYVSLGMGVGVIADFAADASLDTSLAVIGGAPLFEASASFIAVKRGRFQPGYANSFIECCLATVSAAQT